MTITHNVLVDYTFKITTTSPRGQWVDWEYSNIIATVNETGSRPTLARNVRSKHQQTTYHSVQNVRGSRYNHGINGNLKARVFLDYSQTFINLWLSVRLH